MIDKSANNLVLRETLVAIVVAVIVGIICVAVEKITSNPFYVIAAGVAGTSLLGAGLAYAHFKRALRALGIRKVYTSYNESLSSMEMISKAKGTVEFIGISARTFFESDELEELVKRKMRAGVVFRFLVLCPDSRYVNLKAADEGDDPEAWRHDIRASIARIQNIFGDADLASSIKTYDAAPVWRAIFVDDQVAYVSYYPHGYRGKHSPLFVVDNTEVSVYDPLHDYFNSLWQNDGQSERAKGANRY